MKTWLSRSSAAAMVFCYLLVLSACASKNEGSDQLGSAEKAIIECNELSVGQSCDSDDSLCTVEVCELQGGSVNCVFQQNAADGTLCESDGLPCTSDTCQAGVCNNTPLPEGTLCDDGFFCTANDACDGDGLCQSVPLDCDDGNDCTANSCDEDNNTCVATSLVGQACDDGDACTENTICGAAGLCQGGGPVSCADGNECTSEDCDSNTGCTFAPIEGGPCDDSFFCTIGELCDIDGNCQGEANCLDGDPCTADSCDEPGDACINTITPGATCTDLNTCTENDLCGVDGTCAGSPVPNGTACGTGGGCIAGGMCMDGNCQGGAPVPDRTPCDDEDMCTEVDICLTGACVGYPINCIDDDPCTADGCDPATGCVNTPIEGCVIPDAGVPDAGVPDGPVDAGPADDASADATPGQGGILGGGGCSQGDQHSPLGVLLLAAILALGARRGRASTLSILLAGAFVTTSTAEAQELDSEIFQAGSSSTAYLSQPGVGVLPHLEWNLAMAMNVSADPLVLRDPDTGEALDNGVLVSRRNGAFISAGIGIADRFELGFSLPFVLTQDGNSDAMDLSSASLGDLRLDAKARIASLGPLALAATLAVSAPTGDGESLYGESNATVSPRLIVGSYGQRFSWSVNAGARIREQNQLGELVVDDELTFGAGASFAAIPRKLWIVGEGYGRRTLKDGRAESTPAEALVGARVAVLGDIQAQAAAGIGIGRGYGTPAWRGILGFAYVPQPEVEKQIVIPPVEPVKVIEPEPAPIVDTDGDGIYDDKDKCINDKEDFDDFEDEDGCPDLDNDGDGIADLEDKCPVDAEIVNGIQDDDGCPDEGIIRLVEDRITLQEKVLFDINRARVKRQGKKALKAIVELYKQHPEWEIMSVEGHADYTGPSDYNLDLSKRRAERVMKEMIKLGMDPAKIKSEGFGETRPLVEGRDEEAQIRNRRVEFVILNLKKEIEERILIDPETGKLLKSESGEEIVVPEGDADELNPTEPE